MNAWGQTLISWVTNFEHQKDDSILIRNNGSRSEIGISLKFEKYRFYNFWNTEILKHFTRFNSSTKNILTVDLIKLKIIRPQSFTPINLYSTVLISFNNQANWIVFIVKNIK